MVSSCHRNSGRGTESNRKTDYVRGKESKRDKKEEKRRERDRGVWPEGVARVALGYTLRALAGFSRSYIPCRGHHPGPPIR